MIKVMFYLVSFTLMFESLLEFKLFLRQNGLSFAIGCTRVV